MSDRLLADVDIKLRSAMLGVVLVEGMSLNGTRPFGGLNVLCCGDFWQFRPLVGGSLANIPVEWICRGNENPLAATTRHGQSLLWAGPKIDVQGWSNSMANPCRHYQPRRLFRRANVLSCQLLCTLRNSTQRQERALSSP